jgi:pimeloyl-ACP methyl ester carboxylesterase
MTPEQFQGKRRFAETRCGRIAYVAHGEGPAAVFLHGVPLNGYHWRGQMDRLSDLRQCIALDLLGLGATEPRPGCDLSFSTQARMVIEVLDQLGIKVFDLVGNDSGGAIAQLVAVRAADRIRTLVLTNCDVHDNCPPPAFMPAMALARVGRLADTMAGMLDNLGLARSALGLGTAFENPQHITDTLVRAYIGPLVETRERRALLDGYVSAMDPTQTVAIEGLLSELTTPTLILWGTDDVFFPVQWAHWLNDRIAGASRVVEIPGARLFFCEERPEYVSQLIREHWSGQPTP